MTALLYHLDPERVCVAMDTCTLDIEDSGDRVPGPFCTKVCLLPHLHTVVCGTGIRSLIYYWNAFLQQNAVARDIVELDNIARAKLPELARECRVTEQHTSTIYHFGYWPTEERMVGIAYRSTNGFDGDELQYGLGIKPPDGLDLEQALKTCEDQGLPAGFIEVMKLQKVYDDARPSKERLGIGGEVQYLVMDKEGCSLRTCHRFDDYDGHFEAVRTRARSC